MEPEVYARMAAQEAEHWWFVGRRRIVAAVMSRVVELPPQGARLLEAGCGTGGNLMMLSRFGAVSAFEPDDGAQRIAREKGDFDIRAGRLPDEVPFAPRSFDLVAALDVLEHLDDDLSSLCALRSRLRPGGWLLVTVPAFDFLWSEHDERHHHRRRYSRTRLVRQVTSAGFTPVVLTCFNSLLFPLVVGVRMAKKVLKLEDTADDIMPSHMINRVLMEIFASERHLVGRVPLRFGVSLLMIAREAKG